MKILLIHCRYRLPGGEDAVFETERAMLERHGHTVITYERSNAEKTGFLDKLLLPLRTIYSRKAAHDVREIIEKEKIELVHVHNTLLVISPSVIRAAKKAGVPVVQTLHNFRLFCPNGILMREGKVCEGCPRCGLHCAVQHKCYRGSTAQSLIVAMTYTLHRLLGTYKNVTMIALTSFNKEKLLEFNRRLPTFSPEYLEIKPNSVADLPAAPPLPWEQRKNHLMAVGRLEELKGLPVVLEAWELLGDTAPNLLIAGRGKLEAAVRRAAEKNPRIHYLGQLPRQTMYEYMAQSKGVIAASLCYESFGLVPAEAHALGTPVIASDLGNVGGSVIPDVDGLKFEAGNAAALAAAVQKLLQTGGTMDLNRMAQTARERYNEENNYSMLMEIYKKAKEAAG